MKRVCIVTGSRADFGLVYSLFYHLQRSSDFELTSIVTAMHLSPEFGNTFREIEKAGFPISARVDMLLSGDSNSAMAKSLGIGVYGIAQALEQIRPDLLIIPADRVEHLAAAVAAATMNIPIAHMNGGDVSGSIDESYRHAITKLAHLHFPNCQASARRIVQLGEHEDRVFCVGDASLDVIHLLEFPSRNTLLSKYKLPLDTPFILTVFHPVSSESETAMDQMNALLDAVREQELPTLILSPNADAGGHSMIGSLKENLKGWQNAHFEISIPHVDYLALMKYGYVLVGNSSSGILEAPFFGLPCVNVGSRQNGRERASNVLDTPATRSSIASSIKKALRDKSFIDRSRSCTNPYGDGHAAEKILAVLGELPSLKGESQKTLTY